MKSYLVQKSSLIALAVLTLSGCSTMENSSQKYAINAYPGISFEAMKEWSQPFESAPAKRAPSSEMVSKPNYFWEADTLKIPVTAGTSISQFYNIKFNQYSTYDMKETVVTNVPRLETVWEDQDELVLVCESKGGVGKSEYWNAFYKAPTAQKASALAKAIEGVGDATAKGLVSHNYFNSKPHSWNEFEDEIHKATQDKVISKLNEYQVLFKFRQENMKRLGYNTQATGDCRLSTVHHSYPHDIIVNEAVQTEQIVPHRDLISSETKRFHIEISHQRLQSFEQEMLVFSFDHDTNQISLAPASYNNYILTIEDQNIAVVGASRKSINLPNDVLPSGATLESSNGMASFTAPINNLYIPKSKADGYLFVSMQVFSCNKGLFGCSVMNRDERYQPAVIQAIQPGSGLVNYKFPVSPGRKMWVRYWVNTASSPWYVNNVVMAENSPEI